MTQWARLHGLLTLVIAVVLIGVVASRPAMVTVVRTYEPNDASAIEPWPVTDVASADGDLDREILAALAALEGRPGTIRLQSPGTIEATVVLQKGQVLEFGPGQWRISARPGMVVDDACMVVGAGEFRTELVLTGTAGGALIKSADFDSLTGMPESEVISRPVPADSIKSFNAGVKGVTIRDIRLNGGRQASPAIGIQIYGFWWKFSNLLIEQFGGDGIYSEWIATGSVYPEANDAPEAWLSEVKILSNGGNGWTVRGPHDTVATGLMSANNTGWGIDVHHKDGHNSGGGLMLTAAHLYGNKTGGLRTAYGANIHAYGLESESNTGPGLLVLSNDNIIQGEFYANTTFGIQIGEGDRWSAFNTFHVQSHNNREAQICWGHSGGGNMVVGSMFAMKGQALALGKPTESDGFVVATGGEEPQDAPVQLPK